MVKPFLRWAGSKKRLIPELQTFWNNSEFDRYFEPFVGSAQLYFSLSPKEALLSDINEELVLTYNEVKKNATEIFLKLSEYQHGKDEYYKLRDKKPNTLSLVERASRFIYLNRFCFNGLYRTNQKGEFNVPFAGSKTGNLPNLEQLLGISNLLKNTEFLCGDFETVIRANCRKGDFVYFDPPYAVSNVRMFRQYNPQTFGLQDLERLSRLLNDLNEMEVKFLVSYANSEEANLLSTNWNVKKVNTLRFMKGFGKDRNNAEEILIYN